jgi:hypothetical protein
MPGSATGRGALGRIASSRISGSTRRNVAFKWPRFATIVSSSARWRSTKPASSARFLTSAPIANVSPSAFASPPGLW